MGRSVVGVDIARELRRHTQGHTRALVRRAAEVKLCADLLRALGDPDAYPATDIALINALGRKGETLEHLKPWRAYAAVRLWRRAARKGVST